MVPPMLSIAFSLCNIFADAPDMDELTVKLARLLVRVIAPLIVILSKVKDHDPESS